MKYKFFLKAGLMTLFSLLVISVFAQDGGTPVETDNQGWIPYLKHPLVLAGFVIMLFIGLITTLIKSGTIKLSQASSGKVLNKLITYGFILALLVIVGGFYIASKKEDGGNKGGDTSFSNIDQSGSGNTIGNGNNSNQPDSTSGNTTFENINQSGENNTIGNNNN